MINKKILIGILGLLLVTTILAGDNFGISLWNKEKTINKDISDFYLEDSPQTELNFNIDMKCSENECLYSVYQKDIINIKNKKIQRDEEICLEKITTKEGWKGCNKYGKIKLTEEELRERISDLIKNKIIKKAESEVLKEKYDSKSKGNLILGVTNVKD